ncbi:hypothetical protein PR048_016031, partial [Dryococelus australis]
MEFYLKQLIENKNLFLKLSHKVIEFYENERTAEYVQDRRWRQDPLAKATDSVNSQYILTGINFLYVSEEDIEGKKDILFKRFPEAKVIPNTRDLHAFIPVSETKIKVSTTSLSDNHQVCFIQEEYARLDGRWKTFQLTKVNTLLCFSILQAPTHLSNSHTVISLDQGKPYFTCCFPIELSLATTGPN